MSKFLALTTAALLLSAGIASSYAASVKVAQFGGVPRCESNAAMNIRGQLAAELRLSTKLSPTIDVWNGCLKVTYSDGSGHTVTTFYDPDTLSPIHG